ncbi:methyltransferase [Fulvitalea axinellae]|uniref:Methyltransferase n=1 Tax=Fulvitalea axinellae TaxID=1182444 RepID=A0AAU9C868_9BACT|nr:methyltransferase [Fulvitalea axinellae]
MDNSTHKEWFGEWFDSPYYHILYKDRDYTEAQRFIDVLSMFLDFRAEDKILDLACGKGRHSIYLNKKGLDVVGVDLSPSNVAYGNRFANDRLSFFEHDMRFPFRKGEFDYVLNMFTSFGYFDDSEENRKAIISASENLKPSGMMILDFLNPIKVIRELVAQEQKNVDGYEFKIRRFVDDRNYIVKDIFLEDKGEKLHFQERVKAIGKQEFEDYFRSANLGIRGVFGDYSLNAFDPENSDRMIFVTEKED